MIATQKVQTRGRPGAASYSRVRLGALCPSFSLTSIRCGPLFDGMQTLGYQAGMTSLESL